MIQGIPPQTNSIISQLSQPLDFAGSHISYSRDLLISRDNTSFISSIGEKVLRVFHSVIRIFKRICCCFCSSESDANRSLSILKEVQKELPKRIKRVKDGGSSREALQKWWRKKFDDLHISVREHLLVEDIKLYAPDRADEDKWAKDNMEMFRPQAIDFVANLYKQTEKNGKVFDPIDDICNFISNTIAIMEKQ